MAKSLAVGWPVAEAFPQLNGVAQAVLGLVLPYCGRPDYCPSTIPLWNCQFDRLRSPNFRSLINENILGKCFRSS